MSRFETLNTKVAELYNARQPGRAPWADWLYPNHVVIVAKNAKSIAEHVGADIELSQVAALLHDIADIKMNRSDEKHEDESLAIARQLMEETGYSEHEIALVVDDAIRYHSCHGDNRPQSKEGLVLATADSLAHLQTDFYIYATVELSKKLSLAEIKAWTLAKIDRDLNNKISFDDIREQARPDYDMIKKLFSR